MFREAIDKLTRELKAWRENASHLEIQCYKTWRRSNFSIGIDFKEQDQIDQINQLMKNYNENIGTKVSDSNAEGSKEKVKLEGTSQGRNPTIYQ